VGLLFLIAMRNAGNDTMKDEKKKMRILVTGATGFIGSHLSEKLAKEGYNVRALIRKKEAEKIPADRRDALELLKNLDIELCFGDLLDKESLKKAVKDRGIIFHLAAIARPMAIPNEKYFEINEKGTENLLEACKGNRKIKKIIVMSSVSAVGPTKNSVGVNEMTECYPVDVYGWSKLAEEKVCRKYQENYNLPIVILRPPMVFGPRDFEMLKLFKAVDKRFFPISGNEKCMEFLYVGNLVNACLLAMEKGKDGEKYHISNGEHYSINEIINEIEKAEGKRLLPVKFPKFVFVFGGYAVEILAKILNIHPPFKHDTVKWMTEKFWYSDISKARKELGYSPEFSLEEGVRETVKYYKEKGYCK